MSSKNIGDVILAVENISLAFGGVNEMRFSESADFTEGGAEVTWRDHLAQVQVSLTAGEGAKPDLSATIDIKGVPALGTVVDLTGTLSYVGGKPAATFSARSISCSCRALS